MLTRSGIQQMLRRYGKQAGINGVRCSPHTFRHTFAKNYLLNGGDIYSLKAILGHNTFDMVNEYLHFTSQQITDLHHKFSPMDKFFEEDQQG